MWTLSFIQKKLRAAAGGSLSLSLSFSGHQPQISCQGESQILTGQASLGRVEQAELVVAGRSCHRILVTNLGGESYP